MKKQRHPIECVFFSLSLTFLLIGCKTTSLPTVKYSQYLYEKAYTFRNDTLKIELKNPLHSPLRIWFFSQDEELQKKFNAVTPITLNPQSNSVLTFVHNKEIDGQIRYASLLGDISKKIDSIELDLPFPKNKKYTIIQENNTNFTHNTDWSRYALDFNLKTNDTICSATDGYVVGIVDQYKFFGTGAAWQPFANFITIYEPDSGIFTQYVHLVQNGSLVKIGDEIKRGQAIALSGNTGKSTREHLHFNCLIPVNSEDGLKSVPITFVGGIKGINLKKGDVLKK
jgi:murein DD-endopeptidase MepM/ murein hydrolase activator NlpD